MSGMVDDLASLPELDEKTLLEEIQSRYKKEKIYTYIGDILIAVNPYKSIPIYGKENWDKYRDVKVCAELPPHLYIVSDSAYQNLKRNGVNQCCVVSGESGAGKTESTKLMIEHIVHLCQHDTSQLHQHIVQANPLLEAFGNAQTVINDNSSRFGKFIELSFDGSGKVLKASISEYLLEKSRVVTHSEGEKSFHIFYYLFAGLDKESKEANLLSKPEEHRIMRQFPSEPVYEDKAEMAECKKRWDNLMAIMRDVGFIQLEIDGILAILAAILHIADIKFVPDTNSDGVLIQNENILGLISQLLDVKAEELVKALISNTSSVGIEKVVSLKNESQANDGRDALAKALYGQLFTWIVSKINDLLNPNKSRGTEVLTIGILDIYGFENFKCNSFEQLCINIANEQLQFFFNLHIFKLELEEYEREGITGNSIKFVDNKPLLDLFMDRLGLFALLDEQSRFPQASDQSLLDKLDKNLGNKPEFNLPRGQPMQFTIQHFAGLVSYNVTGFLEKNRDTLSDSIMRCLKTSTSLLVTEIFNTLPEMKPTGTIGRNMRMSVLMKGPMRHQTVDSAAIKKGVSPSGTGSRGTGGSGDVGHIPVSRTLASHFKNSLDSLLMKLLAAQPHFIRCIKPNAMKEPSSFDREIVLRQLSYTGVLETVKIRKQGYSSRLEFSEFVKRYGLISSVAALKKGDDGAKICRQVLDKSGVQDWQVGKTKVFLKYYHFERLNLMLSEACKKVVTCQKYWRGALAQMKLNQLKAAAAQYSNQWKTFCQSPTDAGSRIFSMLQQSNEQDLKDKHAAEQEAKIKASAHGTVAARGALKRDHLPMPNQSLSMIKEEPTLPEGFRGTRASVNSTTQILLDETLGKLGGLSTDIWAKMYYMEKNAIVGKVYLRDWEVIVDDSDTEYNGLVIGVNSSAFEHFDDAESKTVLRDIGKGVKITRDADGNIYLTKLSKSDVIVKGLADPERFCFSSEVAVHAGKLKYDQIKIFDMGVFKQRIAKETQKPTLDAYSMARLCAFNFAFVKDSKRDVETPCWVCIINFTALDLLGKPAVLDEVKKMTKMSDKELTNAKKYWSGLDFKRKASGFGGARESVKMDRPDSAKL